MSRAGVISFVVFLGFLGFALWGLVRVYEMTPGVRMSVHGWIAMDLGMTLTAIAGGGLMWLAFYSARKGYDERVDRDDG